MTRLLGRPSEVIYPLKLNADGSRKRGITWPEKLISPRSNQYRKHPVLLGLFGKKETQSDSNSRLSRQRGIEVQGAVAEERKRADVR